MEGKKRVVGIINSANHLFVWVSQSCQQFKDWKNLRFKLMIMRWELSWVERTCTYRYIVTKIEIYSVGADIAIHSEYI